METACKKMHYKGTRGVEAKCNALLTLAPTEDRHQLLYSWQWETGCVHSWSCSMVVK